MYMQAHAGKESSEILDSELSHKSKLKEHIQTHTEEIYNCEMCGLQIIPL